MPSVETNASVEVEINVTTESPAINVQIGGGGGGAVDSVNGQTGSVVLAASDVGAIPAPASASAGQFLVYDGSTWTAQTLATWQGGSY